MRVGGYFRLGLVGGTLRAFVCVCVCVCVRVNECGWVSVGECVDECVYV